MARFVLVHGSWSDAAAWAAVADRLSDAGHRVATPDLPGHGPDTTPPKEASLDGYAAVVAKEAAALGSRVTLVGHSMAGTVISTVGEHDPALIAGLIYVAAFLLDSPRASSWGRTCGQATESLTSTGTRRVRSSWPTPPMMSPPLPWAGFDLTRSSLWPLRSSSQPSTGDASLAVMSTPLQIGPSRRRPRKRWLPASGEWRRPRPLTHLTCRCSPTRKALPLPCSTSLPDRREAAKRPEPTARPLRGPRGQSCLLVAPPE